MNYKINKENCNFGLIQIYSRSRLASFTTHGYQFWTKKNTLLQLTHFI